MMKITRVLAALSAVTLLIGCEESLDDQMSEYMEFYYPATTEAYYDVVFDWGSYLINTHEKPGSEVHEDSAMYLGYITLRPNVSTAADGLDPHIFLISPNGAVWSIEYEVDIAKSRVREEVTVQSVQGGTMTSTRVIDSAGEPVIDHFLDFQDAWTRFGTLVADGDSYELERLDEGG